MAKPKPAKVKTPEPEMTSRSLDMLHWHEQKNEPTTGDYEIDSYVKDKPDKLELRLYWSPKGIDQNGVAHYHHSLAIELNAWTCRDIAFTLLQYANTLQED